MDGSPAFVRVSISPVAYYQEAWHRVKGQYGLFFAVCLVGILLGSVAPLGILLGPMMCGIYLCFRRQSLGEPVTFDLLFKGFDHFAEAFIAALLMMAASLVVMVPLIFAGILVFFASVVGGAALQDSHPAFGLVGCAGMAVFFGLVMLVSALISILFSFTFPLIMDRGLKGMDAVKLSFQAARANLGGLILLALANALVSFLGVLCCYVGAFLVLPLSLGTHWICYERVFGILANPPDPASGAAE
ncbi:MAG: hypothetical protein JST05_01830 [Acidobacteria bacterium]|nr:hypothetical protein [Acidobacteriota bacterium]